MHNTRPCPGKLDEAEHGRNLQVLCVIAHLLLVCPRMTQSGSCVSRLYVEVIRTRSSH